MSGEAENVDIITEKTIRPPEHEVWLSFINDEDAVKFNYWWEDVGKYLFQRDAPGIQI
jgi:hypothetical protein